MKEYDFDFNAGDMDAAKYLLLIAHHKSVDEFILWVRYNILNYFYLITDFLFIY